jgi:5,10-methylenetetrahydromethanopterin reductase
LTQSTVSGSPAQVRGKLDELADGGVTELVYQPCGPDTRRELEKLLEVANR